MATIKSFTSLEQSKKLAEILPLESADMWYQYTGISIKDGSKKPIYFPMVIRDDESDEDIPAWSLAALLKYLSEIKPQVYTLVLFPSESKWKLHFVEYGNCNVCEVSCDNPVDACYEMIIRLNELKML